MNIFGFGGNRGDTSKGRGGNKGRGGSKGGYSKSRGGKGRSSDRRDRSRTRNM